MLYLFLFCGSPANFMSTRSTNATVVLSEVSVGTAHRFVNSLFFKMDVDL